MDSCNLFQNPAEEIKTIANLADANIIDGFYILLNYPSGIFL